MKNRKVSRILLFSFGIFFFSPALLGAAGGGGGHGDTKTETKTETKKDVPKAESGHAAEVKKVPLQPPIGTPYPRKIHEAVEGSTGLKQAKAPFVVDDKIIYSYKPASSNFNQKPRSVNAVFDYESFTKKHLFEINSHGVYFLVADVPHDSKIKEIQYRLIVDGLWILDPKNPQSTQDASGIKLSVFSLGGMAHQVKSPQVLEDGVVEFYLFPKDLREMQHLFGHNDIKPGQRVYLTGSFARWDPYLYEMKALGESPEDGYGLRIRLPPGDYQYRFVIGTREVADPLNQTRTFDGQRKFVSLLKMEKKIRSTMAPTNWGEEKHEPKPASEPVGAPAPKSSGH